MCNYLKNLKILYLHKMFYILKKVNTLEVKKKNHDTVSFLYLKKFYLCLTNTTLIGLTNLKVFSSYFSHLRTEIMLFFFFLLQLYNLKRIMKGEYLLCSSPKT